MVRLSKITKIRTYIKVLKIDSIIKKNINK